MKINIIIILLQVLFFKCDVSSIFHFSKFYFEYNNETFTPSLIQKNISEELLQQIPLENKIIFNNENENKLYINLNEYLNINKEDRMQIIQKGDIFTDGNHLFIFYGNSYSLINGENYNFLGQLENIDRLVNAYFFEPSKKINFKVLCKSSLIENDSVEITFKNPSFFIFNKDSFNFDDVPNLYFNINGEPLYPYCRQNLEKGYEIQCSFSEKEIKNNYFKYENSIKVFEIIPGCKEKVETGIQISFFFEIPHCFKQKNKTCLNYTDLNKYKLSDDGKSCKYTSYFYYLCIGLPILNVAILFGII